MLRAYWAVAFLTLSAAGLRAQTVTTTVAAGAQPYAVAVNPVTNKIYVANTNSNNVTVIGGASNAVTTVAAGTKPYAVAVNPVTNHRHDGGGDQSVRGGGQPGVQHNLRGEQRQRQRHGD